MSHVGWESLSRAQGRMQRSQHSAIYDIYLCVQYGAVCLPVVCALFARALPTHLGGQGGWVGGWVNGWCGSGSGHDSQRRACIGGSSRSVGRLAPRALPTHK